MTAVEWVTVGRIVVSAVALVGLVLMGLRAHRAVLAKGDHFTVFATSALIVYGLFTIITQLKQLGQPLKTWYGVPMLAVAALLVLKALNKSKV